MPCRRCSNCSINFPTSYIGDCGACQGELNHFTNTDPDSDWQEMVAFWLKKLADATEEQVQRFELALESMIGADDFLTDCGDPPKPGGYDFGGKRDDGA